MSNLNCECRDWARIWDKDKMDLEAYRHHPRCEKRIKVYAVNDCEWVASTSSEEARRWYLEDVHGELLDSGDELCDLEPRELSSADMEKYTFNDVDNMLEGDKDKYTFEEALSLMIKNGKDEPSFYFATTEY